MEAVRKLTLSACGRHVIVECGDQESADLVGMVFDGLLAPHVENAVAAPPHYAIRRDVSAGTFQVTDSDGATVSLDNADELLFHLDKHITIGLQGQRPDLYFLHAAAVALEGQVAVLAAPAGTGKSTLALALLEQGFTYLSDELAPVDLQTMKVHPYARSICLKSPPPAPYRIPPDALDTGGRIYVSGAAPVAREPLPLTAIVFIRRESKSFVVCRSISAASAAARLVANVLNALAHDDAGLDAAATLGRMVPCFELDSTRLDAACVAIRGILAA